MSANLALPKEISVAIPEDLWEEASCLPCLLSMDLPLQSFTVRELLQLEPGVILETRSANGADVPIAVNSRRVGWAEFEVMGRRLGIRITELG
jgi:flagellar motor switch/type III secretory pathway protein FliN